jgi:hypothetical protein
MKALQLLYPLSKIHQLLFPSPPSGRGFNPTLVRFLHPICTIRVDRGVYNIAVTSEGMFHSSRQAMHV